MLYSRGLTVPVLVILVLVVVIIPTKSYAEDPTVEWIFQGFFIGDGCAGCPPNFFTITDPDANLDPEKVDTIKATVQSIDPEGKVVDSIEITLTEQSPFDYESIPDPNSGIFRVKNIIFSPAGWKSIDMNSKLVLIQEDPENFFGVNYGHTPEVADVIPDEFIVSTTSTSETFGSNFPITETGPDSHNYTATIRFSQVSSDFGNGIILAHPGDIVTGFNQFSGEARNGLIAPNSDPTVGAIYVPEPYGYLTVIYKGIPCIVGSNSLCYTNVSYTGGGGGVGSGGPVLASPRIVLDILAPLLSSIGSSDGSIDRSPPSLHFTGISSTAQDGFGGILASKDQIDYPLVINDKGYNLPEYSNTIDPIQLNTGQHVDLSLEFLESSSVEHVALHFVDEHKDELSDTDPRIIFDKGNVEKSDPDGVLGDDIIFTTSRNGDHSKFNFGFSFDEPTKRHLMITAWDDKRNSANTKIFEAFDISGQPVPKEENHLFLQDLGQHNLSNDGTLIDSQNKVEIQAPIVGYDFPDSLGKMDRHDMKLLYDAIDYEKTRATDVLSNNFDLNAKAFVKNEETKQDQDIKRAPELSWSNVGHKMRDFTKTPQEISELIKNACAQENLKAEKVLKSLLVGSKYQQH